MTSSATTSYGAFPNAGGKGVSFAVWAPDASKLDLVLFDKEGKNQTSTVPLTKDAQGIFRGDVQEASAGTRYKYTIDGNGPFPDPASRYQPDGVHGASTVVDHSTFKWTDQGWKGIPKMDQVSLYELHVGTFTKEGTYNGVKSKLQYLKNELGVTAIELLPLADFPGRWNWGYDGVALYAPARCYGTPEELKDLVNTAHGLGLAVIIDLVYNHLGPDGNYLNCYNSHYFTKKFDTPWGAALNYDPSPPPKDADPEKAKEAIEEGDANYARAVRAFVVDNASSWMRDYHFDGARLDATHAIVDYSSPHVLQELVQKAREAAQGRSIYFFAEDDRNEADLVIRANGLDSLWADDFHHQVRVCVAGDNESYFANFSGSTKDLADTIRKGWFFCGQEVPSSGEKRGTDPTKVSNLTKFCCCIQNHDQIGNRALGERLHHQIQPDAYRAVSALLLLVPEVPMLFQGQEWAASTPFQYFTDHNAELGRLVTEGRRKEFGKFKAFNDPATREKIPDPQAQSTFENSKLKWEEKDGQQHKGILNLYKRLLKLRHTEPAMDSAERNQTQVEALDDSTLILVRKGQASALAAVFRLKSGDATSDVASHVAGKTATVVLTSNDDEFKAGDNAKAPTYKDGKVQFSGASVIVLRLE